MFTLQHQIYNFLSVLDGEYMLVVLLQQVHGVHRHSILCATQEEPARVYSPRDPPRNYAHVCLVRAQVCTWYVPLQD